MPTAKGIKSIARLMKNGEIKREKIIKETTKWIVTTSIGESGVVSVISAIVWFGIGAICGAIILVSFSVITYDERIKKKAYKEIHKVDEEEKKSCLDCKHCKSSEGFWICFNLKSSNYGDYASMVKACKQFERKEWEDET